jgi:Siphovirus Gp157
MAAHSTPSTDPSPIFPAPQRSRESANIPRPFTRDRLPNLLQALATHDVLKDALRSAFPDVDDQTLRDTLEGISDLPEMVATVVRSHLDDLTLARALRSRLSDIQERLSRIENRGENKRALVASVMERADLRKLIEPDFTVSLRQSPPSVIITAEGEIPETYWKPQPPKLDRKALHSALSAGKNVPGAGLGYGCVTIAVRTR